MSATEKTPESAPTCEWLTRCTDPSVSSLRFCGAHADAALAQGASVQPWHPDERERMERELRLLRALVGSLEAALDLARRMLA